MFEVEFSAFLKATRGRCALPWQSALANEVLVNGWPSSIGVATGLGKTTTINVAVWALAREAHLPPSDRQHPTRIWYVVDRRLLVDEASLQVAALAKMLDDPTTVVDADSRAIVTAAAQALASRTPGLTDSGGPLFISTMRGAAPRGHRPPHAAKPSVMCTTVAMYASRLLFSGYGMSQRLAPIDAALVGTDSLVLVDEAHLAAALLQVLERTPFCDASSAGILRLPGRFNPATRTVFPTSRQRPRVVSLSATTSGGPSFDLTPDDHLDPIVRKRLDATKPTELRRTVTAQAPKDMADRCRQLLAETPAARSALVFVNSPVRARKVIKELNKDATISTMLVTGQLRDLDADLTRTELLAPNGGIRSGRTTEPDRPLVVVATQTLEVGADIDVDILVTELADQRAIIQRLGRLNRRGDRPWAKASLWYVTDETSPLYGEQIPQVVAVLVDAGADTGTVDLCPAQIVSIIGSGATLVPNTAELLPAHLFEWAKTSTPDPTSAPPELFFSGRDENRAVVAIAWRADTSTGIELVPAISDRETIDVPIADARLVVSELDPDDWFRYDPTTKRLEAIDAAAVRPGMNLVLNTSAGRYSRSGGWDPDESHKVVRDLSPLVRRTIELNELTWANVVGRPLSADERDLITAITGPAIDDDFDVDEAFAELYRLLVAEDSDWDGDFEGDSTPPGDVLWDSLKSTMPRLAVSELSVRVTWPSEDNRPQRVAVDAYDELSADAPALIVLHEHLRSVGSTARRIATDLGLSAELITAVETAGRFHDLGKADLRFQEVLNNHDPVPLAKSTLKSAQLRDRLGHTAQYGRWPRGSRHELLSVQLLDNAIGDGLHFDNADLVRHLVISHHGYGRPSCPAPPGAIDRATEYTDDICSWNASTNPSRADNEQPTRFRTLNETYGYWGLALLETIVRQADHLVSELTEVI